MSATVYEIITDRLVAMLERGVVPWRKPWSGGSGVPFRAPRNLVSGRTYRGVNVFLLGSAGYASPYWVSFKQAQDLGGYVRRGEKSTPAIFWKLWQPEGTQEAPANPEGEEQARRIPLLRYYNVFNLEQCDGIEAPKGATEPSAPAVPFDPIASAARIVAGMPKPPTITHAEPSAFYRPITDTLNMPKPELFNEPAGYYSTLFHELAHSTGHAARLARSGITNLQPRGTPEYAREELVAEMASSFLAGEAGIFHHTAENSAAYLDGWIKVLRADSKAAVIAAAQAQKAADYVLGRLAIEQEVAAA